VDQDFSSAPHHDLFSGGPGFFIMLAVGVLLIFLGMMIGGWMRANANQRGGDQVLHTIYLALRKCGAEAAGQTNGNVIGAASTLRTEIDRRLGSLTELGGPLKDKLKALDAAHKAANEGHKPKPETDRNSIAVMGPGMVVSGLSAGPPAQQSAVELARLAIGTFNDYWGDHQARIGDLRKARAVLLSTPPVPDSYFGASAHYRPPYAPPPMPGPAPVHPTEPAKPTA
jgi:hypothetical protein